ncbi:MAG: hypothetical protein ACREAY_00705 [Nitrososphaera sp.]
MLTFASGQQDHANARTIMAGASTDTKSDAMRAIDSRPDVFNQT